MAWRGSFSRSLISTARASTTRSSPSLSRLRPPLAAPRIQPRRFSFANPRNLGELGCAQSLLPFSMVAGARLTSHITFNARACCELSHGIGIDREEWKRWVTHGAFNHQKGGQ